MCSPAIPYSQNEITTENSAHITDMFHRWNYKWHAKNIKLEYTKL
jgi:hypothetical protein